VTHLSHVLCAVDINEDGPRVFSRALTVSRNSGARLSLLHAASPELSFNRGATERVDFLRQLRSLAEAAGVEVRVDVQRGYVTETILHHARTRRPDVVVIGMSRKERRRGLSGWVAEQVLRDAPCPTLIVPKLGTSDGTIENILCAVDFSPTSHAAISEALRFASSGWRPLTLLHVVPRPDNRQQRQSVWIPAREYYRDQGAVALDKLRFLVPPSHRTRVTTAVAVGQPTEEILRAARGLSNPLLVIGGRNRNRVGSRLFGKTGTLLRDATFPMLAVPISAAVARTVEAGERAAA